MRVAKIPAVSWRDLPQALDLLKKKLSWKNLDRLCVGSTGLWAPQDKKLARTLLRGRARSICVMSDLELAHAAAFAGGPGVLIIAGTGSVGLSKDEKGLWRRAGGLGPLLGDEGSGFWIGRQALRDPILNRALKSDPLVFAHAKQPVRQIAALAPRVFSLKLKRAHDLREKAAQELASLAVHACRDMKFLNAIPISWRGGLFENPLFLKSFLRALKHINADFVPAAPKLPAEQAAATLNFSTAARIHS